MHMMKAHVLKLDFVFCLQKYVRRKTLAFLMNSVHNQHNFLKSTDIFLSNDYWGPSTLSLDSRGLKVKLQCTVRSKRNGRERGGSVVTKVVHKEGLLLWVESFHLSQIRVDKVTLPHSKAGKYQTWVSITKNKRYLAEVSFMKRHSRRRMVNPPRCCFIMDWVPWQ